MDLEETTVALDGVQLWHVSPERITDAALLGRWLEILSPTERNRLSRIGRAGERHRFLVSHALVRCALSGSATVRPDLWRFRTNEFGRPEIVASGERHRLRFNLSHTQGMSLCAIADGADVGVDVERIDRQLDEIAVADRILSPDTAAGLERLAPERRREEFLRHWTLREAYVKARGEGMLRVPRDAVTFLLEREKAPRASFGRTWQDDPSDWQFFSRALGRDHLFALAVRRGEESPHLRVIDAAPLQPSGSSSSRG